MVDRKRVNGLGPIKWPDKMDRYVEPDTDPDPYGRKEEPAWGESANSYSGQQFVFEADWYES